AKAAPRRWWRRAFGDGGKVAALQAAVHQSTDAFGKDEHVVWSVLPELPQVQPADVRRWGQEVRRRAAFDLTAESLKAVLPGDKPQPMVIVLPKLEDLLKPQSQSPAGA